MCFVWISEQTAIISLYSINRLVFFYNRDGKCFQHRLVFITQTESVYSAVRIQQQHHKNCSRKRGGETCRSICQKICTCIYVTGRDSAVGIVTGCGLDGPGS